MYISNGFVCGGKPEQSVKVTKVRCLADRIMLLTFNNGETRLFDSSILQGPVFEPLKDEHIFLHASIDHGVVTWADGEIDCSPEFMYDNSYEYEMAM